MAALVVVVVVILESGSRSLNKRERFVVWNQVAKDSPNQVSQVRMYFGMERIDQIHVHLRVNISCSLCPRKAEESAPAMLQRRSAPRLLLRIA